MKITLTWKVAQVLLIELQKKFESSLSNQLDRTSTSYYFLTKKEREVFPDRPSIGYEIMNILKDPAEGSEKAVYNYIYIPATKRRNQTFSRKSLYPTLFLKYIGFEDLEAFLKYCNKNELLEKIEIEQQLEFLGGNKDKRQMLNFKFYYFDGKHLKLGLLTVQDQSKVQLSFYSRDKQSIFNYLGQIEGQHNNITNIFLTRQNSNDKVFICLNTGQYGLTKSSKLIMGTFAGASKNANPIGGQVFLETIDPANVQKFDIRNTQAEINSADPRIALHLSKKYISTSTKIPKDYNSLIRIFNNKLGTFHGHYISYTIHNSEYCITKSIFKIYTDFTVEASHDGDDYNGTLSFNASGKALVMNIRSRSEDHFFQTVFRLSDSNNDQLLGVYSGISKNNLPVSGKQVLLKSKLEDEVSEGGILKLDSKEYKILRRRYPVIENYFANRIPNNNFTDSVQTLRKINSIAGSGNNLDYLSGTYNLYFRSTGNTVRKYILEIRNDGGINFHGLEFYRGSFHIKDHNLIINIHPDGDQEYLQQIICHFIPSTNKMEKLKNTVGIFSGLSDSRAPVCVRCILERTEQKFEEIEVEHFSLNSENGSSIPKSFLNYLKHEIPNVLLTDKKSDYSEEYFNDVIDFGEVFFNSTCYLSQQYTSSKDDLTIKNKIRKKIFKHIPFCNNSIKNLDHNIYELFNFKNGTFKELSKALEEFLSFDKSNPIFSLLNRRQAPPETKLETTTSKEDESVLVKGEDLISP